MIVQFNQIYYYNVYVYCINKTNQLKIYLFNTGYKNYGRLIKKNIRTK